MSGLSVAGRSAPLSRSKNKKGARLVKEKKNISLTGCCMTHGISSLHKVPSAGTRAWHIAILRNLQACTKEENRGGGRKKNAPATVLVAKMKVWLFCCTMEITKVFLTQEVRLTRPERNQVQQHSPFLIRVCLFLQTLQGFLLWLLIQKLRIHRP